MVFLQLLQSCINITLIKYLRCYEVQPSLWQVTRRYSDQPAWTPKKVTVYCLRYNIIVICKQENYTIIDKIQPSISRTKIKGTLVFNEGGGGWVLWYFHTCIGFGHFWGLKILNLTIFGGFRKNEYFLGVWRFCGYFLGIITKLNYIKGSFLCILGSFLKVKVQIGRYFWGC